jgi:hypothetical protein
VGFDELKLLFVRPGIPADVGSQLVVPPFTTLLSNAARKVCRDGAPAALTVCLNEPAKSTDTVGPIVVSLQVSSGAFWNIHRALHRTHDHLKSASWFG